MELKKLVLFLFLLTVLTNISYSNIGEWDIIPRFKVGSGKINISEAPEDYCPTEISVDFFYEINDSIEIGIGIGYAYHLLDKAPVYANDKGEYVIEDKYNIETYPVYRIVRYNFNSELIKPYITAKLGTNPGKQEANTSYYEYTEFYSEKEKIEMKSMIGIGLGIELQRMNLELGYEIY